MDPGWRPPLGSKDCSQHLAGLWLIEDAEFASHGKALVSDLKAFLSRRKERFRPPYGRVEIQQPRQCVIVGTINEDQYLIDSTGNRRFWPADTGIIDITGLKRDREQIFAEAVMRFNNKEHWWPDRTFERQYFAPEQELRYDQDPWEERIQAGLAAFHNQGFDTSVMEVAVNILGYSATPETEIGKRPIALLAGKDGKRIATCLRRLGYRKDRNAKSRRWTRRPEMAP